ncbi:MAG TPA: VOC family protein [Stellaceae bacterium]|nr:VOC family protein [Stellaceae bacterium]
MRSDLGAFAARGLDSAALDFSRDARLPDGGTMRVAFSLAVATDAALPGLAFFTCRHHQSRDLLWQPDYQRHANGARRIVEVVLSAADPAAHRHFFERLLETEAITAPGILSLGAANDRITLMTRDRLAERFPECAANGDAPRFAAYRVTVADLGAVKRQLQSNGVLYRSDSRAAVIAPDAAFGMAIEFISAEKSEARASG